MAMAHETVGSAKGEGNHIDYYTKPYTVPDYSFFDCKRYLMGEFRQIYAYDITRVLEFHKGQYAKAHRSLSLAMEEFFKICPQIANEDKGRRTRMAVKITCTLKNDNGECVDFDMHNMATFRRCPKYVHIPAPALMKEVSFVKEQTKIDCEVADRQFALSLIEEECKSQGQTIECACCFRDCVFETMAQCMEGHLVCVDCLNAYMKEAVYGSGRVTLSCMAFECSSSYPQSELKRCLSSSIWNKLDERIMMENISCAQVEDLVKCPYCDFAAILSPKIQEFYCMRDNCQKVTCRDCGTDWNGHEGLPCSAVEKRDETHLRKQYEEKMTKAKVRICVTCKAQFTKEDGCNKMTCRCGTTMCYICRESKITYAHFCRHPLDPGYPCKVCKACSLWTNPEEDEKRAIEEMQQEAQEQRKAMGFDGEKCIGALSPAKTPRLPLGNNMELPQVAQEVNDNLVILEVD